MRDYKQQQIGDLVLFQGCSRREIELISRTADAVDLLPGAVLAVEGTPVHEFAVVVSGTCAARYTHGDVLLGPGAYYGERGLLDGERHEATIVALSHVRLLVFDARSFAGLIGRNPHVATKLMRGLVEQLREADQSLRSLRAVS